MSIKDKTISNNTRTYQTIQDNIGQYKTSQDNTRQDDAK